jgi:lipopolysaccharide export LptBFGC system permease protein LptF
MSELGVDICDAVQGNCKGRFFDTSFVKIQSMANPGVGKFVVVELGDNFNLGSDNRTIALVADDDPERVLAIATAEEGTTVALEVSESSNQVSIWADSEIDSVVTVADSRNAADDAVNESQRGALERIAEDLKEQADKAQARTDKILIGVFVLAVVIVVAFAVAAPKIKIPKVNVT